jgi:hypothetical protein
MTTVQRRQGAKRIQLPELCNTLPILSTYANRGCRYRTAEPDRTVTPPTCAVVPPPANERNSPHFALTGIRDHLQVALLEESRDYLGMSAKTDVE